MSVARSGIIGIVRDSGFTVRRSPAVIVFRRTGAAWTAVGRAGANRGSGGDGVCDETHHAVTATIAAHRAIVRSVMIVPCGAHCAPRTRQRVRTIGRGSVSALTATLRGDLRPLHPFARLDHPVATFLRWALPSCGDASHGARSQG
jgi:hypothetical protein